MPRLAAKGVKALKALGRYGDGEGLYIEVSPTGAKSWILRVMVGGRRRDIGLGGASYIDLGEARDEARRLRKLAKAGGDPVVERNAKAGVPTFEEAAREVYGTLKPGWRKGGVHLKHWGGWR